jgi:hypothetical protein
MSTQPKFTQNSDKDLNMTVYDATEAPTWIVRI